MALVRCGSCGQDESSYSEHCHFCGAAIASLTGGEAGAPTTKPTYVPQGTVRCPKCGSEQVGAGNKGFGLGKAAAGLVLLGPLGLLGGVVGSKKIVVSCLNCGHQWQPGS
jgi:ribosomal protein S27E